MGFEYKGEVQQHASQKGWLDKLLINIRLFQISKLQIKFFNSPL